MSLCKSHIIPGVVRIPEGSKAKVKNMDPTPVDEHNVNVYRVIARHSHIALGIIVIAGLLCFLHVHFC